GLRSLSWAARESCLTWVRCPRASQRGGRGGRVDDPPATAQGNRKGYGEGATRNGEMVEREPGQLRCCPQPVQRRLLDGCHRRGRPVHVGRVRGEGGHR